MTQEAQHISTPSPALVAAAGYMIPGAGYWLIGQASRGTLVCVTIVGLYLMGLLIAGVRVIEVPGYDSQTGLAIRTLGNQRISPRDSRYARANWSLTGGGFISEIANKPWFVGQILAGPLCVANAVVSVQLAQKGFDPQQRAQVDYPRPHAQLETVGTLYTAIAGMLNLLVVIDASHRAALLRNNAGLTA